MKAGISDFPLRYDNHKRSDLLDFTRYADGLCEFIKQCETPMSIALQGDWGSGKTSLLNNIESKLTRQKVKTIFINTWLYSQINQGDSLVKIFFGALLKKIAQIADKKTNDGKDSRKFINDFTNNLEKFWKYFGKPAVSILAASGIPGVDVAGKIFEKVVFKEDENAASNNKPPDPIEFVETLRDKFGECVAEVLENCEHGGYDRIVILVDDIDRLSPAIAVELLEAIKLFMDVEKCVFVLAVDDEVVIQGIRHKLGPDVPREKCKNFFDKIIQLPFQMPTRTYNFNGMIKKFLKDGFADKNFSRVSQFATHIVDFNPRLLKRLLNSFWLSEKIHRTQADNTLRFCVTCIQIRSPLLYSYLGSREWLDFDKDRKLFRFDHDPARARRKLQNYANAQNDKKAQEDAYIDKMLSLLTEFNSILDAIYEGYDTEEKRQEKYNRLHDIIHSKFKKHASNGDSKTIIKLVGCSKETPHDEIQIHYEIYRTDNAEVQTYYDYHGITKPYGDASSKTVVIPSTVDELSVDEIGKHAFCHCDWLTEITIPAEIKKIEEYAFDACKKLSKVTFAGNPEMEYGIFNKCIALKTITLPAGMSRIPNQTFSCCSNLSTIEIPNTVTQIGVAAFWDCIALNKINPPNNESKPHTTLRIPDGITKIGNNAFGGDQKNESIKNIYLPGSVAKIGDNAFGMYTTLKEVYIPRDLEESRKKALKEICKKAFPNIIPKEIDIENLTL